MHLGRTIGRYLAGALLLALLISAGLTGRIVYYAHADGTEPVDAIVVMGAAQYNGTPSPVFAARLDHAVELYRRGIAGHIVTVGGGQPGDLQTEGQAGRDYLAAAGIDDDSLVAVGVGSDTLTSLRAVNKVLGRHGWVSVMVVSDAWHLSRCAMIAQDLGLRVEVSAVTAGPATAESVEARYIWRELLAGLFYRLVGGSSGAGSTVI